MFIFYSIKKTEASMIKKPQQMYKKITMINYFYFRIT